MRAVGRLSSQSIANIRYRTGQYSTGRAHRPERLRRLHNADYRCVRRLRAETVACCVLAAKLVDRAKRPTSSSSRLFGNRIATFPKGLRLLVECPVVRECVNAVDVPSRPVDKSFACSFLSRAPAEHHPETSARYQQPVNGRSRPLITLKNPVLAREMANASEGAMKGSCPQPDCPLPDNLRHRKNAHPAPFHYKIFGSHLEPANGLCCLRNNHLRQ
jgi:hypothetical protein